MSDFIAGQSVIVLRDSGPKMYTVEHISKANYSMSLSFMGGPELLLMASGKNAYNKREVFKMTEENCRAINTLYGTDFSPEEEFEVTVTMTLKKTVRIFASSKTAACLQLREMHKNGNLDLCTYEDFHNIHCA